MDGLRVCQWNVRKIPYDLIYMWTLKNKQSEQKENRFNTHLWLKKKKSPESKLRRNLSQHNKGHIQQTHSKHCSQWWKTENISPKIQNKTMVSTLTTIIEHSFGSPSHSNQKRKRKKSNSDQKRSKTLSIWR